MKIWLNKLKEGDTFYKIFGYSVYKCKHLGDAHNMNFKMSRIKFEILDDETIFNEDLLGNVHEAFVNQYVYEDEETAKECLKKLIDNKIGDLELDLRNSEMHISVLKKEIERITGIKKELYNERKQK